MLVGVDAEVDESSVDDVIQCEDAIVSQSRVLLPTDVKEHLLDTLNEIVRPLGLETRLVLLERANSLALLFLCMTLSALVSLRDQWSSGQLTDIVQSVFTFLSRATRQVRVKRLSWPLTDYERCLEFFSPSKGN